MKSLYLVRHAKSSWSDFTLADRDRPLTDRGRRDAARMGKRLAQRGLRPDLIISSPAVRALATAKALAHSLGHASKDIVVDERLYACSARQLLDLIQSLDDRLKRVVVVGHNPSLAELAHDFCGDIDHVAACAVAEFEFDSRSWSEIGTRQPAHSTLDDPRRAV
jgi:phosphohistidine phosphatase